MNLIGKEFTLDGSEFIVESLFSQSEKLYVCKCLSEPSYKNTYTFSEGEIMDALNENNKIVLDCKIVRDTKLRQYKEEIKEMTNKPSLLIIQVGNRSDSNTYVRNKIKWCEECGIDVHLEKYEESVTTNKLISDIDFIQDLYTGVIVQLPLPKHIDTHSVLQSIEWKRDVDGLTEINIGKVYNGNTEGISPCTPNGIIDILDYYNINLTGKEVLIVGRSNLVAKPLAELMMRKNATCTICHTKTKDLQDKLSSGRYDIVIASIGKANELKNVKADILINVGINFVDGQQVGDFDMESCTYRLATSNTKGGTGVTTCSAVVGNILKCYNLQHK